MVNIPASADHRRTTLTAAEIKGLSPVERMHWIADHAPNFRCDKPCVVYFIGCLEHGIKIGSGTNLVHRFQAIQSNCPIRLTLMAQRPGGIARERAYHKQFAAHRLHFEWFSPHPDILAEIERLKAESAA